MTFLIIKNFKDFLFKFALSWVALMFLLLPGCSEDKSQDKKLNILFIAIDDLRPEIETYGVEEIQTPHIDRLAGEGVTFNNAFAQQPICMASRNSLLTGYYPDRHRIYSCLSIEELIPEATTLNENFAQNGYRTLGMGKVYHYGEDHREQFGDSWIHENPNPDVMGRGYLSEKGQSMIFDDAGRGPAYESPQVPDNAYRDGYYAEKAVEKLQKLKDSEDPFFYAVGFHKPHLPFNAPQKYWDLYNREDFTLPANDSLPENYTRFTPFNYGELRNYAGIPNGSDPLPDSLGKTLMHGYYACVSYVDAQVGKIMDALEQTGLDENTMVVLWGDHGWKLGEHDMWGKHTNFEIDVRVPLMIKVPGETPSGVKTGARVELLDLYPTLSDLAGIPVPGHVEGKSFAHVLENPQSEFRENVYSLWPSYEGDREDPEEAIVGYAIQNDRYRYIEWTRVKTGSVLAVEMYDHKVDPGENRNVAPLAEYDEAKARMAKKLAKKRNR